MLNKRVLLIHNIVAPYRLPLFDSIGERAKLRVLFCTTRDKRRKWSDTIGQSNFEFSMLRSLHVGPLSFNPTAAIELFRFKEDVLIVIDNEETYLTSMLFCAYARLRRRPYIVWSGQILCERPTTHPSEFHKTIFHEVKPIKWLYFWAMGVCRWAIYKGAASFLAYSNASKEYMVAHGVDPSKIRVGTQAMPTATLASPSKGRTPHNKLKLLYLGYLRPEKGVDVLVEALRGLPGDEVELNIVGDGPERNKLVQLARGMSNVRFHPYAEGANKANWFVRSDLFVLPTFYDPWGHVVTESLYYGTPVIVTDSAAASCVITNHKNGIVLPAGDVQKLRNAIKEFIDDSQLLRRMQAQAATPQPRLYEVAADANNFIWAINKALV